MKISNYCLCLFLCSLTTLSISAQVEIKGRVFDADSQEPLSYATVASIEYSQGTLTNTDGAFSILVEDLLDSLSFSYLGYETQFFQAADLLEESTINLQPQQIELADITVLADDDYLYQAIFSCRKGLRNAPDRTARTYFQLVTNSTEQPIEMIQAYYNTDLSQRGITDFRLKNGRVAMALQDDMFFVNLGTTQAITRMDLYHSNGAFNKQPLQLNLGALRRQYDLTRLVSLSNPNLYHIGFEPRQEGKELFSGELWIDKRDFSLHKLILRDEDVEKHPFYSVFEHSSIGRLGLELSFTFEPTATGMRLNHINWDYEIKMIYATPRRNKPLSAVEGEGVLYFYDYEGIFWEPFFEYDPNHNDYRKISFLPYNQDFWDSSHGLVYSDRQRAQMQFFSNNGFLMNHFQPMENDEGFFEFNNPHWQPGMRVMYREPEDLEANPIMDSGIPVSINRMLPGVSDQVSVQLFLDVNRLGDSLHYTSATVLDIFETHALPPYDSIDHCLLNIYFDLCELERRKMMDLLQLIDNDDIAAISAIHQQATLAINELHVIFFREVRGVNKNRMLKKWNAYILEQLGIDNMAAFNVDL